MSTTLDRRDETQLRGDSSDPHIEIEDLVVRYGDVTAVNAINLAIRQGEHLTLLGPSGCGKATTQRAIAALEHPAVGEIRIDGKPVYSSRRSRVVDTASSRTRQRSATGLQRLIASDAHRLAEWLCPATPATR